jgi:DNA mismatch repair protein MutH
MLTIPKLLNHCENIAGLTIAELAKKHKVDLNTNNKGIIGQLLELELQTEAKNKALPDFIDLGVELKTIPVNDDFKPLESTYVSMVSFNNMPRWSKSFVRLKLLKVLWIPILKKKNIHTSEICYPIFKELSLEDEYILSKDYEELCEIITFGDEPRAHLGKFMQVRPKALNSKIRSTSNNEIRHPLGFYLRSSYTKKIFNNFI